MARISICSSKLSTENPNQPKVLDLLQQYSGLNTASGEPIPTIQVRIKPDLGRVQTAWVKQKTFQTFQIIL